MLRFVSLKVPTQSMVFLPLGDLHVGSRHCDWPRLRKTLKWAEDRDAYILGIGDWANLNLKSSKGSVWEDDLRPQEQLTTLYDLFDPFAKRGRLIAVLSGNHEKRLTKDVGFEFMDLLAEKLGVQHLGSSCALTLYQPGAKWQIFATHGSGGGSTPGARANRLTKYAELCPGADLIVSGHHHDDTHFKRQLFAFNPAGIGLHTRYHYVNGSFQKWGGYAQDQNLQPNETGCYAFHLQGRVNGRDQKKFRAEWLAL